MRRRLRVLQARGRGEGCAVRPAHAGAPAPIGGLTLHDVIIVGAGGMGTAAAAHLAARGQRVLVLERFGLAHDRGSSHGLTRIIRLAYFEHPSYVPLLVRAYELWRQLEARAGVTLLHITGGLDVGREGGPVFDGARESCRLHGLAHDVLTGAMLRRRFPAWHIEDEAAAVFQPEGGFLEPERCVQAHAASARADKATIVEGETVLEWDVTRGHVRVQTDRGVHEAGQLVLAAGPWMRTLAPTLAPLVDPERQVLGWFDLAHRPLFAPDRFPVFLHETEDGLYYGFPEFGVPGFKIGLYRHRRESVDPDRIDRTCQAADEAVLRAEVARTFPSGNGPLLRSTVCLFTNTPDGHFLIDRHPGAEAVLIVSPCSGHGFKFCSVVGEIVADLVTEGRTAHDIAPFRLARFHA